MFKASLFLVVGMVDAATGTRDLRNLSAIWRRLPVTALVAGLSVASMIGLPPFAGFVAKEATTESLLLGGPGPAWLDTASLLAFLAGSVLTVAYGLRFWWGAFATKATVPDIEPVAVVRPPLLLLAPAALLALGGIVVALIPGLGEHLLSSYADTYPYGQPGHLVLWPGLTMGLVLSIGILALGALLFAMRERVGRWQAAHQWPVDADTVYRRALRGLDLFAADLTAVFQRGSLPFYLGIILLAVVILPGGAMLVGASLPDELALVGGVPQLLVGALVVTATILAVRSRRRLKAVVLTGITGYGTAMLFFLHGAPDLALDQVMVETITLVVFVLVLRRLPAYFSNRPLAADRWLRLAIGIAVGITVAGFALVVPQARVEPPVSAGLPEEAVAFGGGLNVVNVVLVDVRAWDTMGEMAVLVAAATGIASLVFVRTRTRDSRRPRDYDAGQLPVLGRDDPDPMAPLRRRGRASGTRSQEWLRGGRTLAPQRRSIVFEVATRMLFHTMIVFAIWLLFTGHNAPGGGFAAGLVTGLALAVRYLAGGRYELAEAAPLHPGVLLGSGLFLATGSGLIPILFGGQVLQTAIFDLAVPVIGEVHLVTSTIFDIGVYLVVVGLMLDVLRSLGAEIDRQGEASGHDSDLVGPALEPAPPLRDRL
jgi:multicomponent Na+:H+ antiporter subunit A